VTPDLLLAALWRDYRAISPQAGRIQQLLEGRGERVQNDHVALRTFALPGMGLEAMAQGFVTCGWTLRDRYRFGDKHLRAAYWQHPDPRRPKVFISELEVERLSPGAQAIVADLVGQAPRAGFASSDWARRGRPWLPTLAQYRALLAESEYAAWLAAFGFRVNHFTVLVNALTTFSDLQSLNAYLQAQGIVLSDNGGVIKGSPGEYLEQSSTRADEVEIEFADGVHRVPSCYYEFARRYPMADGRLFHGFVPASANRLFESTDVGNS
jgi:hypothetical protein